MFGQCWGCTYLTENATTLGLCLLVKARKRFKTILCLSMFSGRLKWMWGIVENSECTKARKRRLILEQFELISINGKFRKISIRISLGRSISSNVGLFCAILVPSFLFFFSAKISCFLLYYGIVEVLTWTSIKNSTKPAAFLQLLLMSTSNTDSDAD